MKLIAAKPVRMYCSSCDETYSMPQQGTIKLYKELKCPLDDFELVSWTAGGKGKVRRCSGWLVLVGVVDGRRQGQGTSLYVSRTALAATLCSKFAVL